MPLWLSHHHCIVLRASAPRLAPDASPPLRRLPPPQASQELTGSAATLLSAADLEDAADRPVVADCILSLQVGRCTAALRS